MTRRNIRKILCSAMAAGLLGPAGCMVEAGDGATEWMDGVGVSKSALLDTTVTFAQDDSTGALTSDEHCLLPAPYGSTLEGRQVRIERLSDGHTGLCTVTGESTDSKAYMKSGGLNKRFGRSLDAGVGDEISQVTVTDACPSGAPECSGIADPVATIGETYDIDAGASAPVINEFEESMDSYSKVAYTAPHARIEPGTAEQLEVIRGEEIERSGFPIQAYWAVGYKTGKDENGNSYNSHEHYHITSTEISEDSFPGLSTLLGLPSLMYAVSFHGCASCGSYDVNIGGGIEPSFRRGVADLLRGEMERQGVSGFTVTASPPSGLDGDSEDNFVNKLIPDNDFADDPGRGLQIEQSTTVRNSADNRALVARSVKEILDCARGGADAYVSVDDSLTEAGRDSGNTYFHGGSGQCDGYVVKFDFSNTNALTNVSFLAELGSNVVCSTGVAGTRIFTNVYQLSADGDWDRLGGGWREPFYLNGSCPYNIDAYYEPVKIDIPAGGGIYRIVARAHDSAGQPLPVRAFVSRP